MEKDLTVFISKLASKEPTPGGGGASALIGAIGTALCSMVANLTSGKKKYAEFQEDIDRILNKTEEQIPRLLALIDKDAEVFKPLSEAYGIPKENPDREIILEKALVNACSVPYEILCETEKVLDLLEELSVKGSRLAVSDVGVAATACRAAIEGAVLNIYINTKLMKDRGYAEEMNLKASAKVSAGVKRCCAVYEDVLAQVGGK